MVEESKNIGLVVPINGLTSGKNEFSFSLSALFFSQFENSIILDSDIVINVTLEKSGTLMGVDCKIVGNAIVECDRCLEDLAIPVDMVASLTVQFMDAQTEENSNDDVLILNHGETELDLTQFIYDYLSISLPLQKVHQDGDCNPEMLEKLFLAQEVEIQNNETSSPFGALKDLLN